MSESAKNSLRKWAPQLTSLQGLKPRHVLEALNATKAVKGIILVVRLPLSPSPSSQDTYTYVRSTRVTEFFCIPLFCCSLVLSLLCISLTNDCVQDGKENAYFQMMGREDYEGSIVQARLHYFCLSSFFRSCFHHLHIFL